ncbi:uncharacterized protein LOC124899470 [Capsicum annuum]|uniref:uncharacterized protein LOC124899470 n=1 Tax=Capsicum annuum TaxID=4072 RepID=UPI001FB121CE|nr:uncharacterized protein LOC124899470 [Capsicum annuum]
MDWKMVDESSVVPVELGNLEKKSVEVEQPPKLKHVSDVEQGIRKEDLMMKKRAVSYEPVDNLHHCSAIYIISLVKKKAEPGAFTIPYTIGSLEFSKALCDLGESINLMPLAIYKKLGLGDPTPSNMRLVMVDRSVKMPIGMLHDVLVKVADFIFPANLVILGCEVNFKVPIILGRPFLATGTVLVNMELNKLKFSLNGKEISFEVHQSMK